MKTLCIIILSAFIFGCPVRTVYVPAGDAVKLRETVPNVKVWVKTKSDDIVAGKMDLYEGWFCLPLDEKDLQSMDDPQGTGAVTFDRSGYVE